MGRTALEDASDDGVGEHVSEWRINSAASMRSAHELPCDVAALASPTVLAMNPAMQRATVFVFPEPLDPESTMYWSLTSPTSPSVNLHSVLPLWRSTPLIIPDKQRCTIAKG